MSPDGLLLAVNEAWIDFTGYTRTQAIGYSFADFLDPPSAYNTRHKAVPELINTTPTMESRSAEYLPDQVLRRDCRYRPHGTS